MNTLVIEQDRDIGPIGGNERGEVIARELHDHGIEERAGKG